MPSDLQKLARAVLARNQPEKQVSQSAKRDKIWDSSAGQVSQSAKFAGTAKTEINQGDNPIVPLSHALGLGQRDSQQNLGHHPGQSLGQYYHDALSTLIAQCPDHVDRNRWQQAVEDGRRFLTAWGAEAEASGWTAPELFGLHPVPEQAAPNYDRLARLDNLGLIWLLRGRPIVALAATEAIILCPSGATLKFYRPTEAASAEITETINAMAQIGKPTPVGVIDAPALAKQGLGGAPKPARRKADAANHAEAAPLIPDDLSIPEFLRREKDDVAGKAVA
jgi:hypothetical protein